MLRARLLLLLAAVVASTIGLTVASYIGFLSLTGFLVCCVGFMLTVTALTILACTFYKAKEENGGICFDKGNYIHKLTLTIFSEESSLCATFWSAVLPITCLSTIVILGSTLLVMLGIEVGRGHLHVAGKALLVGLVFLACLVVFIAGMVSLLARLTQTQLKIFIAILLPTIIGFVFVYAPLSIIADDHRISLSNAIPIYLRGLTLVVTVLASLVATVYLAFKHWAFLANTWLAQLIKNNFCPRVRMCPTEVPCQSAS
jgi:hypothetical protein